MQHLRTLSLNGKLDLRRATRFVLASPPALKKLVLEKCGDAVEVLLSGNYPFLTSLELREPPRNCDISTLLKEGAWPLVELSLNSCSGKYQILAAALAQFSALRKLELSFLRDFSGDAVGATDLQGALLNLEELSVNTNNGHNFGLFHAEGTELPSIRKFICATNDSIEYLANCPWLKNVIKLRIIGGYFNDAGRNIDDVLLNLNGGAVETLTLEGWHVDVATFSRLELPCLREVDLTLCNSRAMSREQSDILGKMKFPQLETLKLTLDHRGARGNDALRISVIPRGIQAFAAAHPLLRKFSMTNNIRCNAAALQQLSASLAPQLEELTLNISNVADADFVAALLAGAKSSTEAAHTGEEDNSGDGGGIAVAWPALRVLGIKATRLSELLKHVLALAPLCPYLYHLSFHRENFGRPTLEEVHKFTSDASEMNAWPALRSFGGDVAVRGSEEFSLLESTWPSVSF